MNGNGRVSAAGRVEAVDRFAVPLLVGDDEHALAASRHPTTTTQLTVHRRTRQRSPNASRTMRQLDTRAARAPPATYRLGMEPRALVRRELIDGARSALRTGDA